MRFACDKCGRRFSSAAEPQLGLVYRYRCHCGNVIHVQVPATTPGAPEPKRPPRASAAAPRPTAPVAARPGPRSDPGPFARAPMLDTARPIPLPPPAPRPANAAPTVSPLPGGAGGGESGEVNPFVAQPVLASRAEEEAVDPPGQAGARLDEAGPSESHPREAGPDEQGSAAPRPDAGSPHPGPASLGAPAAAAVPPPVGPASTPAAEAPVPREGMPETIEIDLEFTERRPLAGKDGPAAAPATPSPPRARPSFGAVGRGRSAGRGWAFAAAGALAVLVAGGWFLQGRTGPPQAGPPARPAIGVAPASPPAVAQPSPAPATSPSPVTPGPQPPVPPQEPPAAAPPPEAAAQAAGLAGPPPAAKAAVPGRRREPAATMRAPPGVAAAPVALPESEPAPVPAAAAVPAAPERPPAPPPPAAAPAEAVAAPPASSLAAPTPGKALAPAAVQAAVAQQRAAFDRCVEAALGAEGGRALAGRKAGLLVLVGPDGIVEAAEVEEPDIERTPLGACLRAAAGRLLFPPFDGEPVGLRVPLVLGGAAP